MLLSSWWIKVLVGVALLLECPAQDKLTFTFGENSERESTVEFLWPVDPNLALQRSPTLAEGDWETLLGTRGNAEFSAIRQDDRTMFYRLARVPESGSFETTPTALEWRLTEMMINQIDRAVNPHTSEQLKALPPDNGDGTHSLTKSGATESFAWATQPGLIRIYSPAQDGFHRAFKLYSSKDSVASLPQELDEDIANTRSWLSWPDKFTNLNEPITNADGSQRFPIIDPRAASAGIEGFAFPIDKTLGTTPDTALPMPAEWLYVLQDGALGTLSNTGAWLGEGDVSANNPIVARIAYWADDETTKLNVNIASEGEPWDVPRADTIQERAYAMQQPVNGEVQRYPGHPSMTSLSSILFPGKSATHENASKQLTAEERKLIYALTPRVVHRESPADESTITLDNDPEHRVVEDWIDAAKSRGVSNADVLHGFVTTSNPAPELTIHGLPRISMWPIRETNNRWNRTEYDKQSYQLSQPYNFLRGDSTARFDEFYRRGNRHNVGLYQYLMHQTYKKTPGYGKALAAKYGARMNVSNYEDVQDYDKDHFMIAFSMLDHIRSTNILDFNLAEPYADPLNANSSGLGTLPGLSLIDRNLKTGTGTSAHTNRWSQPTLEPHSAGRDYTLSELALVAFVTGEATITAWDDRPVLGTLSGASVRVMEKILQNRHPGYANWLGRKFGPTDVGKTFVAIEVGLIPEAFSPSQGTPRKVPIQTLRLLTGGAAYRGGFSAGRGLQLNGVPLQLWGETLPRKTERGPLLSTVNEGSTTLPQSLLPGWQSMGGAGGPRLFRFGTFELVENGEGWYGHDVLPNGGTASSGWHCQTLVVVEKGAPLVFTQEEAIQIALYTGSQEQVSQNNIERLFNFRFAQPGRRLIVPAPQSDAAAIYQTWSRRMGSANTSPPTNPFPMIEPNGKEVVKGLSVTHGDVRHVALKRVLPSEMFNHHPAATRLRSSHALTWATSGGTIIEPSARQGTSQINRSLVTSVRYAEEILPDFVQNPAKKSIFAPLLGKNYHFPIDPTITRDFDNGLGNAPDGPYINTSDDGEDRIPGNGALFAPAAPYFEAASSTRDVFGVEHHFARRMAPSPVAFGSIPSAAQANAPWTCLLFRPNLADPKIRPHLGEAGNGMVWERNLSTLEGFEVPQMASVTNDPTYPADHLWLDYFWMPSAQPAETSSPFATQGKVNMNYQLFPYTYIKRATAMHAVLKGEEVMAIPTSAGPTYKSATSKNNFRHRIDASQTLSQFDDVFARGEIFMTASEICEQFLIPEGQTWDGTGKSIRTFWDRHRLSGDNTLERPYAGLYSRLTTQSNAFRMHYRIQTIEKGVDSAPDRFDSEKDTISEDRRGAKLIERVLRRDDLPDYLNPMTDLAILPRAETFYDVVVRDTK